MPGNPEVAQAALPDRTVAGVSLKGPVFVPVRTKLIANQPSSATTRTGAAAKSGMGFPGRRGRSGELRIERRDASGQCGLDLAGGVVREDLVGAGGDAVNRDPGDVGGV